MKSLSTAEELNNLKKKIVEKLDKRILKIQVLAPAEFHQELLRPSTPSKS
jgi:hypothetical protein